MEAAVTERTKAIILPYPNNPTGAVVGKEQLQKLAEVFIRRDLIVISDEIYAELIEVPKQSKGEIIKEVTNWQPQDSGLSNPD